ncbi:hypothetical protein VTL71DRAFT_8929 [Oculimacula yallundae]|uniref:HTH APSES-type domain-containing protein n=1 Tax=Oculimacula yallundae TaxID=86028 RepID=A0ABR4BT97_9HELO
MLSVASLLNPVKPEPRGIFLPSSPSPSFYTSSSAHGSPLFIPSTHLSSKKSKMTKDGAIFAKGKIKGEVNFPPFECLDEEVLREVRKFQIFPLGNIQEYARHIPYNSEKKTFLEKTGRESFEVFQYVFKVPGDDKEYVVMWDYNIGLVRITPFFKCCKYSKTTPAKMLNMNAGLKEITHSITGGALAAQGYWMPFSCALAVCTTFCSHIAGALIPIFGPSFPSLCVPPEAPEHGRMIIDSSTIHSATLEAEAFRQQYSSYPGPRSSTSTSLSNRESYSPMHSSDREHERMSATPSMRHTRTPPNLGRSLRLKRAFGGESPYGLMTDTDFDTNASESSGDGYFLSPVTPVSTSSMLSHSHALSKSQSQSQSRQHTPGQSGTHAQLSMAGWHAQNMMASNVNSGININGSPYHSSAHSHSHSQSPFKGPNPLLSAIPRSTGLDVAMSGTWQPSPTPSSSSRPVAGIGAFKRRVEEVDADDEYDGETASVVTDDKGSGRWSGSGSGSDREMEDMSSGSGNGGAEKKAAWLLMKLSVRDGECGGHRIGMGMGGKRVERESGMQVASGFGGGDGVRVSVMGGGGEGPRIKRRRATSM